HGLLEITATTFSKVAINRAELSPFKEKRVHRLRSSDLFVGPFVVVHKSPPALAGRIGVAISSEDAVFNETFYGYSPTDFANARGLTLFLTLVLGSKLAVWYALVTSGEFGFEREVIEKATLDRMPLPDFRKLSSSQHEEIEVLYERLSSGVIDWEDVDKWVAKLYGLKSRDLQVVADTLEFNLPFAQNRRAAQIPPTAKEQARFCEVLAQ